MISSKLTSIKSLAMLGLVLTMGSCNKPASFFSTSTGDPNRKTVVKIKDAGDVIVKVLGLTPLSEDFVLLELSRDPNSQADLNQPLTVKLALQPSLIADYNTANGTALVELPASSYQFIDDINSVTFEAGQTIKEVSIKLDKSGLDLSNAYALGVSLAEAGSGAVISATSANGLVAILVKNKYDGLYHSIGIFHHPVAGDRPIDEDKQLNTVGPNSVEAPLGDLGGAGYFMILTVNPDNTVTITPSGVTPNIDQHWGPNYYDPATQSFVLKYSYNVAAPRIVEETITKK